MTPGAGAWRWLEPPIAVYCWNGVAAGVLICGPLTRVAPLPTPNTIASSLENVNVTAPAAATFSEPVNTALKL
jgi:hypothetical protein